MDAKEFETYLLKHNYTWDGSVIRTQTGYPIGTVVFDGIKKVFTIELTLKR